MLNIAYCVNDAYVQYCTVSIKSVIETNKCHNINFYILIDQISKNSINRIKETIAGVKNVSYQIITVDDTIITGLKTGIWSKYTWYRILIPSCLPNLDRILYLDADTVVTDDIGELFEIDLTDKSVAGALDYQAFLPGEKNQFGDKRKNYICAGVLLMNLKFWRDNELTSEIIDWATKNEDLINWPDQDTINHICEESKVILPLKYGSMGRYFIDDYYLKEIEYRKQIEDCFKKPAIIHYAGHGYLPWIKDHSKHKFHSEWIKYNKMLKHPAKRKYESKGIVKLKVIIWNLLHSQKNDL